MNIRNALVAALAARKPPLEPLTISALAVAVKVGRSHLTQVLRGQRRGVETWPKLRKFLTAEEYEIARKDAGFPK